MKHMEVYLSIYFLAAQFPIIQILEQHLAIEVLHYFYPNKNFYIITQFLIKDMVIWRKREKYLAYV